MILYIDQLQQPQEFSVEMSSQECGLSEDIGTSMTPIHLDAYVRKVQEEITVEGRISTQIEMICSRCLTPHDEYLDDTFEVIYRPRPEEQEVGDEIELEETDLNISYYVGDSLAIAELIREQLLLLLPVKPLCKDDCAGLCPSCGQNLNEGSCTCPKEAIDSRFAVLGQLLPPETFKK